MPSILRSPLPKVDTAMGPPISSPIRRTTSAPARSTTPMLSPPSSPTETISDGMRDLRLAQQDTKSPERKYVRFSDLTEPRKREMQSPGSFENTLFVASLPSERTEGDLESSLVQHFAKYGPIVDVRAQRDSLGRPYAFVTFVASHSAAFALHGSQHAFFEGRNIRIEPARINVNKSRYTGINLTSRHLPAPTIIDPISVFVGNLPSSVDEAKLADKFKRHGEVQVINLIRRHGDIPNFALISYSNPIDAAEAVMDENDTFMDGREIRVALRELNPKPAPAPPKARQTRSSNGDGGRGFGGDKDAYGSPPTNHDLRFGGEKSYHGSNNKRGMYQPGFTGSFNPPTTHYPNHHTSPMFVPMPLPAYWNPAWGYPGWNPYDGTAGAPMIVPMLGMGGEMFYVPAPYPSPVVTSAPEEVVASEMPETEPEQ